MVTIHIMYKDLSILEADISQLSTVKNTDILIILFKKDGNNIVSLMGHDYYQVRYENNTLAYVQYNDEDGATQIHDLTTGTKQTLVTQRNATWKLRDATKFIGIGVEPHIWTQALDKFKTEMQ